MSYRHDFLVGNYYSLRSQVNELMKLSERQRSRPFFDLGILPKLLKLIPWFDLDPFYSKVNLVT